MAQSNKGVDKNKTVSSNEVVEITNDTIRPLFSKAQIEEKLKILAETPPPTFNYFGAMCYATFRPPDKVSYICPICGEKTVYSCAIDNEWLHETTSKQTYHFNEPKKNIINAEQRGFIQRELNRCRREIQKVKGINVYLDESEFCKHCSPSVKNPVLYLIVNISGESDSIKTRMDNYIDIQLIQEFLNGDLIHKDITGKEMEPLVTHIDRIKKLLGIKE